MRLGYRHLIRTLVSLGPAVVPLVWLLAGQWSAAGAEQRAWLPLTSALLLAALIPIRERERSSTRMLSLVRLWAWSTVAGLVMLS